MHRADREMETVAEGNKRAVRVDPETQPKLFAKFGNGIRRR